MTSAEPKTGSYKDLLVWQKGIVLVKRVYQVTQTFPSEEKFGLTSQLRRAVVSVPSNLAEGQARRTTPDFINFISNAEGSAAELDTQMIIAVELGYCSADNARDIFGLIVELRKMLNALRLSLQRKERVSG